MDSFSLKSFGVVIAFILPGFIATWGLSMHSELLGVWLRGNQEHLSWEGLLFSTIFALGAGLFFSTIRWILIDPIHHFTGVKKQNWDYKKLQANVAAYRLLEENHYRFYQFYGNTFCASIFAYLCWKMGKPFVIGWPELGMLFVLIVLFAGSRDTLKKYFRRVNELFKCP